mmetsp:Transcript_5756/g.18742  ORF Transcript_5756/g.18742 Transcript_5756/m.18742 type:complete len:270 (+) Transcript_5756:1048-1857(+)
MDARSSSGVDVKSRQDATQSSGFGTIALITRVTAPDAKSAALSTTFWRFNDKDDGKDPSPKEERTATSLGLFLFGGGGTTSSKSTQSSRDPWKSSAGGTTRVFAKVVLGSSPSEEETCPFLGGATAAWGVLPASSSTTTRVPVPFEVSLLEPTSRKHRFAVYTPRSTILAASRRPSFSSLATTASARRFAVADPRRATPLKITCWLNLPSRVASRVITWTPSFAGSSSSWQRWFFLWFLFSKSKSRATATTSRANEGPLSRRSFDSRSK